MKESNIDVKALSNAYKEKKKMRDDSNVVKIGKSHCWVIWFKTDTLKHSSVRKSQRDTCTMYVVNILTIIVYC